MIFRVFAHGCLHFPTTDNDYLEWCYKIIEQFQPHVIVNLGDLYEGLAGSRHARHSNQKWDAFTEHLAVSKYLQRIAEISPQSKKVWLYGNHDDNFFNPHPDRVPEDMLRAISWDTNSKVCDLFADWTVVPKYAHGVRWHLGQISFGHGVELSNSGGKDEAYNFGTPNGLDIRAHTHKPERVSQCQERKAILPFSYANVGTGAIWDEMRYMDRNNKQLWGRGAFVGFSNCSANGKECFATKQWGGDVFMHSWANKILKTHSVDDVLNSVLAEEASFKEKNPKARVPSVAGVYEQRVKKCS